MRAFRDDPKTREALDAFTAGVNAHIADLGRKGLPVEFKILDYRPEPWTDYKCALLLKAMAYSLTSYNQDAAMTRMKGWGGAWRRGRLDASSPIIPPLVDPVIPPGTPLDFTPLAVPARPARRRRRRDGAPAERGIGERRSADGARRRRALSGRPAYRTGPASAATTGPSRAG